MQLNPEMMQKLPNDPLVCISFHDYRDPDLRSEEARTDKLKSEYPLYKFRVGEIVINADYDRKMVIQQRLVLVDGKEFAWVDKSNTEALNTCLTR